MIPESTIKGRIGFLKLNTTALALLAKTPRNISEKTNPIQALLVAAKTKQAKADDKAIPAKNFLLLVHCMVRTNKRGITATKYVAKKLGLPKNDITRGSLGIHLNIGKPKC